MLTYTRTPERIVASEPLRLSEGTGLAAPSESMRTHTRPQLLHCLVGHVCAGGVPVCVCVC